MALHHDGIRGPGATVPVHFYRRDAVRRSYRGTATHGIKTAPRRRSTRDVLRQHRKGMTFGPRYARVEPIRPTIATAPLGRSALNRVQSDVVAMMRLPWGRRRQV